MQKGCFFKLAVLIKCLKHVAALLIAKLNKALIIFTGSNFTGKGFITDVTRNAGKYH